MLSVVAWKIMNELWCTTLYVKARSLRFNTESLYVHLDATQKNICYDLLYIAGAEKICVEF